jgi:hypothetical protein
VATHLPDNDPALGPIVAVVTRRQKQRRIVNCKSADCYASERITRRYARRRAESTKVVVFLCDEKKSSLVEFVHLSKVKRKSRKERGRRHV